MTIAALAKILCLASGVFGRPAWTDVQCTERAAVVLQAAERHNIDPVLMVAVDIQECDLSDNADAPIYTMIRGRKKLVGYDACPMGVRIMGPARRADFSIVYLYEVAASKMERWKRWCERSHRRRRHSYIQHYNEGNPVYANQVLAFAAVLRGRHVRAEDEMKLTSRSREIVRRIRKAFENRS